MEESVFDSQWNKEGVDSFRAFFKNYNAILDFSTSQKM